MKKIIAFPFVFSSLLFQSVWLALGQIWANKSRSFLTTLGIVIGVASVTAVIAALTGLKTKVVTEFESAVGSNNIFIFAERPDHGPKKYASWYSIRLKPEHVEGLTEHCPSVELFTRLCGTRRTVRFGEYAEENVSVNGVDSSWHAINQRSVLIGRPFSSVDNEQKHQVCLITPELRDKLRMERDCMGETIFIGRRSFLVAGLLEKAKKFMQEEGEQQLEVFVPFTTAWKLYEPWMMVIANSRGSGLAEQASAELRFFLRRQRKLDPSEPDDFRLRVMERHLEQINNMAMVMTAVAGGIVGISLLVGGIGIMNIMLVSVSERTREIGLRKAVGARPAAILLQFLVEAVVLCLFGGVVGLMLAQLLTYGITKIPNANLEMAYIPFRAVVISFGFSAVVGVFFGFFPALKAARLDPIVALRHE